MPPLLIDIGAAPEEACNCGLEHLYKSLSQDPTGQPESIWAPHENPWLTTHVEEATRRLQAILERIQDAIARFLTGEPIGELAKADPPWLRWDEAAFEAARQRLEAKPASRFTLDDWSVLVDYLLQRYLPNSVINSEAEFLTVRASLLGKIAANMDTPRGKPNRPEIEAIVSLAPMDFGKIPDKVLSDVEWSVVHVAKARAAENISNVSAEARHKMKTICIEHIQAKVLGMKDGQDTHLRQRLFDNFGQLNRDFRRIAVTEAGDAMLQGYIGAQKPGTKVRRQEAYRGACPFCKSISGKVFTVVDPADPKKNGDTDVWVGKDNIGRSASPRMRQGSALVERPSNERWWVAAGTIHPHCRGSWSPVTERPPEVSKEFADWLDGVIRQAQATNPVEKRS